MRNYYQRIRFYLLLLTIFLLNASCEKDITRTSKYYISCKVDGEKYLPNNCANCMRAQILGDSIFGMNANRGFETVMVGLIQKTTIKTGKYILNSPQTGAAYKFSTTTNDRFDTDGTNTGELNIITLDNVNKIVSGTFFFKGYNPVQQKTVNVSEGVFRLNYSDY